MVGDFILPGGLKSFVEESEAECVQSIVASCLVYVGHVSLPYNRVLRTHTEHSSHYPGRDWR